MILRKYIFWTKVMDTLALLGSAATGSMGALQQWGDAHIDGSAYFSSGVLAIVGIALRIWITDTDKDGIVDILQDDNVTEVKTTETKTTTITQESK